MASIIPFLKTPYTVTPDVGLQEIPADIINEIMIRSFKFGTAWMDVQGTDAAVDGTLTYVFQVSPNHGDDDEVTDWRDFPALTMGVTGASKITADDSWVPLFLAQCGRIRLKKVGFATTPGASPSASPSTSPSPSASASPSASLSASPSASSSGSASPSASSSPSASASASASPSVSASASASPSPSISPSPSPSPTVLTAIVNGGLGCLMPMYG